MPSGDIRNRLHALRAGALLRALESRHFEAYYCAGAAAAVEQALSLIPEGASVSWGGSETIREIGLTDRVKRGNYRALDRDEAADAAERTECMRHALACDVFLTSVNAISEDGVLVNIDGVGNRVAAIAYGPKTVIMVVGMNKVCRDVEAAVERAQTHAAPLNALRLGIRDTPCARTGFCGVQTGTQ